jgi:hypothetical protein
MLRTCKTETTHTGPLKHENIFQTMTYELCARISNFTLISEITYTTQK